MATHLEDDMFKNYEVECYAKGKSIIVDLKDFDGEEIPETITVDITEDFVSSFKSLACSIWKDLNPKEVTSYGKDYWEYYDRELDNNGYLTIKNGEMEFDLPAYHLGSIRCYKFNKAKAESFIYDLEEWIHPTIIIF